MFLKKNLPHGIRMNSMNISQHVQRFKRKIEVAHRRVQDIKREIRTVRTTPWKKIMEDTERVFLDDLDYAQHSVQKVWKEEDDLSIVKVKDDSQ